MLKKTDFFFGQYSNRDGVAQLKEVNFLDWSRYAPGYVQKQLNRFLRNQGGRMAFLIPSSTPAFEDFLAQLEVKDIGLAEVYARTDQNNTVERTLACDLFLEEGIVSFVPQWCASKKMRAEEIIYSLLIPLHQSELIKKTYLRDFQGENLVPLADHHGDKGGYLTEVELLMSVARYQQQSQTEDHRTDYQEWAQALQRSNEALQPI